MKFCFHLNRDTRHRCFTPVAVERLGTLVDLKPEAPVSLTADGLYAQAADCDGTVCGWSSLPLDAVLLDASARGGFAALLAGGPHSDPAHRGFDRDRTPATRRSRVIG